MVDINKLYLYNGVHTMPSGGSVEVWAFTHRHKGDMGVFFLLQLCQFKIVLDANRFRLYNLFHIELAGKDAARSR